MVIRKVSHRVTLRDLIERSARRLSRAGVFFGHGTDNAGDEAAALVLHALGISYENSVAAYGKPVSLAAQQRAADLISRRIRERVPAVYLTRQTWFAGIPFYIDERALIPRSAIAELIENRFLPWVNPARVTRVLDIGTGSACIAIACARAFPKAHVDALDISVQALQVAQINVRRHRLGRRVHLIESDHFAALEAPDAPTYDIIVSNPPYVGAREMRSLPAEYRHEPDIALAAGRAGLDSVRVILREAGRFLSPAGLLVVEVGNTESTVRRVFRDLPFVWLEFERGGGGVFMLTAEQLRRHRG